MKIIPNQTILHGRTRYEKGVEYEVDPDLAEHFGRYGWLVGTEAPPPEPVTLQIDNVRHGTSSRIEGE